MEQITSDWQASRQRLIRLLHWPENLGIELWEMPISSAPPAQALLLWTDGLAGEEVLMGGILAPLAEYGGAPSPEALAAALRIPRRRWEADLNRVAEAVVSGETVLLLPGWRKALLLDTARLPDRHTGGPAAESRQDMFGRDLRSNLALIRKRMRHPALVALPMRREAKAVGQAVLLFRTDRALPALVRLARIWAGRCATEEATGRGRLHPWDSGLGFLPRLSPLRWPDQTAALLDSGYVALLVDRTEYAQMLPVTLGAWLLAPGDSALRYPMRQVLVHTRLLFALMLLFLPGLVIASHNYHVEMLPTPFLLAVASARENSPFGVFFEVLLLEALVEVGREAAIRIPDSVPIGLVVVALLLAALLGLHTGFVGPIPVLAMAGGLLFSLALPGYGLSYLVRIWRFYLMLAAVIFGFFGLAACFMLLVAYLCQAQNWGAPFLGPSGGLLASVEGPSSRPPGPRGRSRS